MFTKEVSGVKVELPLIQDNFGAVLILADDDIPAEKKLFRLFGEWLRDYDIEAFKAVGKLSPKEVAELFEEWASYSKEQGENENPKA